MGKTVKVKKRFDDYKTKAKYGNYKRVKRALKKGGLVVTGRRYGKTAAVMEFMHENPEFHYMAFSYESAKFFNLDYTCFYKEDISHRVHFPHSSTQIGKDFSPGKHLIVDEFFLTSYKGPFFAAVSSVSFGIRVLKPSKKEQAYIKKTMKHLSPEQKREFLLSE